ncbi:MAG: sigma-54-dependent Fis family transcriptional regulator, partial [Spirochaetaceae bacterium]|nr:sigma-54-dependent Fis family transcriptional regulator [Spirochaetaceae bacterium]
FEQDRVLNAVRLGLDRRRLEREVRSLRVQMLAAHGDERLVVVSLAMQRTMAVVDAVAGTDTMVLIEGSSGTGKEIIARSIHRQSQRAAGPFVPVNCGALPESLLESELFGYEKGAFTGATQTRAGLFESANGGTLLLDEIGELPLNLQATLLRVLQESEIRRVGGTRSQPIDVRIIVATNRDLGQMVANGEFREDLYYRLRVVPIRVPALRDRPEDIIPLATHFMDVFGRRLGKPFHGIDEDAARYLVRHEWKGNVRELENLIHGIIALYPPGSLSLSQIQTLSTNGPGQPTGDQWPLPNPTVETLARGRGEAERTAILAALREHDGHQGRAAASLGISRTSLWRKMTKYQISSK